MRHQNLKRALTAFLTFSLLCCFLTPLLTAFAEDSTMYLCPRNDTSYTQVTADGRVILGAVTSSYSGVHKSYDIKDVKLSEYEQTIKEKVYVNGIKLSEAMSGENSSAVELQLTEGLMLIKIRFEQGSASVKNPFGITSNTKGVQLSVEGGASIGKYTLGSGDAYYYMKDSWKELKGVKYAEPHANTAYYSDSGKFNVVFYVRNAVGGSGFNDINLVDLDMTEFMAVTEINKVNYAGAAATNSTIKYGLNSGQKNYFHLQFIIGSDFGGNPFSIDNATSGTFRIKLTEGIVTQSDYYIAPFDYSYDFATKSFSVYAGTDDEDGEGGEPEEPDTDLPFRYLVPNSQSDLTYNVGDGRIALWFNIRETVGGSTISDTMTDAMLGQLKEIIQINDVKLSDAMSTDSSIVFRSLSAGTVQILFRIKESADGPEHTNPFGITEGNLNTKGIKFSMTNGFELADTYYIRKADAAYYNFNTGKWEDKDIPEIPEGPVEIEGDYIVPRADDTLMKKVTNSKGTYYQLWFKAQAYISEQNVEDSILVNGISVSDARAVADDPDAVIFNLTNDAANKNYYIYIQCKITENDESLNPFGVTGKENIEVIFGEDLIIGNNTDFSGAKWIYNTESSAWTKVEEYDSSQSKVNLTVDTANTKTEDGWYQIAFTADKALTTENKDLTAAAQVTGNLVINNRTAYRVLKGTSSSDAFKVLVEDNKLYLQFKASGNPFRVTGEDDISIEFCPVFNIDGMIIVPASFTFDSAANSWNKSDEVTSRTVITNMAAHLANDTSEAGNADKYTVINVTTDKSVLENGGSGNLQAASTPAARRLREYVAFNGVTLQECMTKFNNQYAVMVWSRAEGMIFWANADFKEDDGTYSNIENYFGIDLDSDFTFEVLDGLMLNGNVVEPCKWKYDSKTKTFTEVFEDFELPESVNVVSYNNRYGDGILARSTGYQYIIRLGLDNVVPAHLYEAQGVTELESEDYDISAAIRKYFYFDGLNLETWSAYRNSSLNTVITYLVGSHIEIRPFEEHVPTSHRDEVHWLEIKEGFQTAGGVRVNPIKLYYDPEKGYWEEVESFDGLKEPLIITERNTIEYTGKTGNVSNPSWLTPKTTDATVPNVDDLSPDTSNSRSTDTGEKRSDWVILIFILSAASVTVCYKRFYRKAK